MVIPDIFSATIGCDLHFHHKNFVKKSLVSSSKATDDDKLIGKALGPTRFIK